MLNSLQNTCLRLIPSVESILSHELTRERFSRYPRWALTDGIRSVLDQKRKWILSRTEPKELEEFHISIDLLLEETGQYLQRVHYSELGKVINATGIILHTNLGRAVLASEVVEKLEAVASRYANLEFDLLTGKRGRRGELLIQLLCQVSGAEDALVVNNNAAAVLLVLNSLAESRDVLVSRGELVEIGGSFRVPDIIKKGGARLVEVGTTNKTRLEDYRRAVSAESAAILKVHPSNFQMLGFTLEASLPELVSLGRERGLTVIYDVGSASLVDLASYGLMEPIVSRIIRDDPDIVTFSGDKLLGGPQAGIILCKKKYARLLRENPLARALRPDKMTLVSLENTLKLYREPDVIQKIPTLRTITTPCQELEARGKRIMSGFSVREGLRIELIDDDAQVGGGALPLQKIPSLALAVSLSAGEINQVEERFRLSQPPVIGRIYQGRFLLNLRTIQDDDVPEIIRAAGQILGG